jgi:eukaryotic-like serine/threonine-protein kinase
MTSDDARDLSSVSSIRAFEPGKYHALTRLGHGGMADVWLAVARGPGGVNKLVVIKRLKEDLANDEDHRVMFLDEARLAARLSHPNVVQTHDVNEEGGVVFITMEYLDGQPLSALMRACARMRRRLPPSLCAHLCAEALAGLHYAHELADFDGTPLKIVHRDVSPQNVFVTYDGQVKVVDFGIAKAELSHTKTQAGVLKGKAAYMAPEQVMGDSDRRADLFTMGILLWELVTGQRLMAAGSTAKTLLRVVRDELPTPSAAGAMSDPALERIIMRALERDPDKRWQTAKEMRDALEAYVAASGAVVGEEVVAELLREMFGVERAEAQARIKEQMAAIAAHGSGTMPAVRYGSESALRVAVPHSFDSASSMQTGSIGLHVPTLSSALPGLTLTAVSPTPAAPAPPLRRTRLHALLLLVIGAGVGVYVARTRLATHPPPPLADREIGSRVQDEARPAPVAPPPAPSASVTTASASAAPALISSAAPAPTPSAAPAPTPSAAPAPSATPAPSPEPVKPAPRAVWHPHVAPAPPPPPQASAPPPPPSVTERPLASSPPAAPAPSPQGRRIRTEL